MNPDSLQFTRVLLIDNRDDPKYWVLPLELEGYQVKTIIDYGKKLERKVKTISVHYRPHVAVVDLRLGQQPEFDTSSDEDKSGLELIKKLTKAGTHCILVSAHLSPEETEEAIKECHAFGTFRKHKPQAMLFNLIKKAAQQKNARAREVVFDWRSAPPTNIPNLLTVEVQHPHLFLVEDLLAQLFPDRQTLQIEEIGKPSRTSEGAVRKHSLVLKVTPAEFFSPVIVKIGPANRMAIESERYQKFIRHSIGRFYADQKQSVTFWDLGATSYGFLGTAQAVLPTFAMFFDKAAEPEVCIKPLEHFFTEVWGPYYPRRTLLRETLFAHYDTFLALTKKLDALLAQPIGWPPAALPNLLDPVHWLSQHQQESFVPGVHQSITHGDLHADNLFVDRMGNAWAIDFERTGWGHNLRDFAELEIDLISRLTPLPAEEPLAAFYRLAAELVNTTSLNHSFALADKLDNDSFGKSLRSIQALRQIAYRVTGVEDVREYWWALLFDAILVAAIAPTQQEKALIYASVLSERLSRFSQEV
jgi:hypothetical protein